MYTSLTNFTSSFEERLIDFLWREWSALGILGTSTAETTWSIDPEALLLLTTEFARHESRLFDEVLDWLRINSRWINTQRLRALHVKQGIGDAHVLAAIAHLMLKRDPQAKWLKLSQGALPKNPPEALFRQGRRPLLSTVEEPDLDFAAYGLLRPVVSSRALAQPVTMKHPCALQFRLRALFGLGMRADILCYLLTHDGGHASGIAQLLGYSQKRVQDTLIEMADSGLLLVRPSGRLKIYWLDRGQWSVFLLKKEVLFPKWINWIPLSRGLTTLWRGIWSVGSTQSDDYVVSSKMRTLMRQAQDDLFASGIGVEIEDDRGHIAEDYLPVFINNMKNILRAGEQQ